MTNRDARTAKGDCPLWPYCLMLAEKGGEYAYLVEMESKDSLILFPVWNYGRATLCRKTIF